MFTWDVTRPRFVVRNIQTVCTMNAMFVLIHSPLVGPGTWLPVAQWLEQQVVTVLVPRLTDDGDTTAPYWRQHAEAVAQRMLSLPADRPLILVGHSGAGPLLPAIRERVPHPIAGYIFVDAGLPRDGMSRLAEIEESIPEDAVVVREHLEAGDRFPLWTDEELRDLVPDVQRRHDLLAELSPRPLAFFTEPIPVFAGWPDAPCAYIKLSDGYGRAAEAAQRAGWACSAIDAGHFHMLVDPVKIAALLLAHAESMATNANGDRYD